MYSASDGAGGFAETDILSGDFNGARTMEVVGEAEFETGSVYAIAFEAFTEFPQFQQERGNSNRSLRLEALRRFPVRFLLNDRMRLSSFDQVPITVRGCEAVQAACGFD